MDDAYQWVILSCYSSKTIDAVRMVTGEPEWHDEYQHYKRHHMMVYMNHSNEF